MGILRTIGKDIGGFFFVLCLSLIIIMLTVVELTQYNSLKPIIANTIGQQITKQLDADKLSLLHQQVLVQCSGKESLELPLGEIGNATLKCSDIKNTKPEDLGSLISSALFEKIYYKKYNCEFVQCYKQSNFQEKVMLLASSTANQFLNKILTYLWIGAGLSALLLLASSKGWEVPKNFGKSFLVIGIPFFFINILKKKINLPTEASAVQPLINQLFDLLYNRYLIVLAIGVVLLIIGYGGSYLRIRKETKKK